MQGTVRLEARTDQGKVKMTELITVRRPVMAGTLAEIGLTLAEAKARLSKLQARMLCDQVAEYSVRCRVCPDCGVLQPLKGHRQLGAELGGGRAGRVGGRHDIRSQVTLRRLPLSRRGHQPRRV